jgi:hypothetical protein
MSLALCFSTENKSLFHYTNMPFTSACRFKDKVLLGNEFGVFVMTGNTDNGTSIPARIKTVAMNFGTQHRKKIPTSKCYIEAKKTDGRIDLSVTVDGITGSYNTGTTEFASFAPYPVKIGRGLDGIHWQFEIAANACTSLAIESIEIEPEQIRRRGK